MTTKHTPVPWDIDPIDNSHIVSKLHGQTVATLWSSFDDSGEDESEANAHLIAAAPELLDALETILPRLAATDAHGHHIDAVRAAYEAIEKAKGGTQ